MLRYVWCHFSCTGRLAWRRIWYCLSSVLNTFFYIWKLLRLHQDKNVWSEKVMKMTSKVDKFTYSICGFDFQVFINLWPEWLSLTEADVP